MSNDNKLYWFRLYTSFFDKHEIRILWNLNHEYVMLFLRLILESIPNRGLLKYSRECSYSNEDIALLFDMDISVVEKGMQVLKKYRLVRVADDGTISIPFATKCVESESPWADRKRRQRSKNGKLENGWRRINQNFMVSANGKKTVEVDEIECGGYGMLAVSRADGRCECCGKNGKIVIVGGQGEMTDPDELQVLCPTCASKFVANKTTKVKPEHLATKAIRNPPQTFDEVIDYLQNEEQILIVNRPSLEAKFLELSRKNWKGRDGKLIHDWHDYFKGIADRHIAKAARLAKEAENDDVIKPHPVIQQLRAAE